MIIVAVSGGFDPVHVGHINLLREAKALGDRLVVILNNDHWLRAKKGYVFMTEAERATVLSALRYVNEVIITDHPQNPSDVSVCQALQELAPDIFANGGDRWATNVPEFQLCQTLGIKMVDNVGGGKAQSSSALIAQVKHVDR